MNARRRQVLALLAGALGGCAVRAEEPPAASGDIPKRFRGLYDELAARLDDASRFLSDRPHRGTPLFGGELLAANAHRGEALLTEKGLQGSLAYLDALKSLGARGVSVSAAFPLLGDDYPRSSEYWAFYARLANEVRARGLKLHIKNGPLFTERAFTSVPLDYSALTPDRYFEVRMRIAQRAAQELRPDYLSIGNEPSTEMQILKFRILPERYTRFIDDTLSGMRREGTLVGAGSGNWDSLDYIRRFAHETALDFIDLHIYPLATPQADLLRRAVEMAELARAARKRVVVGEAWLYKAAPRELAHNPTAQSVIARDVYGFWAPLDIRFLELLQAFGESEQVEYISPFWTKYLFGYVDFDAAPALASAKRLLQLADQAAARELVAGRVSATGEAYRHLAAAR